ncbi:hypothetical protein, conserved [Trypanosoma brucei gambiense DAL972]|uniref:C2HC/C3H-type domain-containing protein n=1 Tax=Trypanosoma brucei gambiense (strain MHOM/CI/86/DAL972) TaxID=679716 RepID=D0A010_TRYB9|nr:hypothetical protein, conserved [Trypanosoma brucei gambiense DAL972]CBH16568.1 hypothetical protein, conserved [Trypanosoma brucei gambiense DAL972]|eukprot:XP_011778832.1 hypothetical protein, conserved [Trypanosoma brucei gambiense DAL972]
MLSSRSKGPAPRPQMRVCYLCGQQFGSASIGIHIPQCYAKKVAQWEVADPATRGKRPKHPDTVNWQGSGVSAEKLMDEQFQEFTNNLVPCDRCGRKFLPDRLPVHLRGCKGDSRCPSASANRSRAGSTRSLASSGRGASPSRDSQRGGQGKRTASMGPGAKPQLPICYLCGQQFGTSSIGIHVPQCYAKKLAQWEAADVETRGKPPKHPDSFNWKGEGCGNVDEHNDAQFAEFVRNLEPCPNCGRKFLADRLVVHLRSCKPGSTARPPPAPSAPQSRPPTGKVPQPNTGSHVGGATDTAERSQSRGSAIGTDHNRRLSNINPKLKRLPKGGTVDADGRECPRCSAVEYDKNAKYCRECGANLASKNLAKPCAQCGESIPQGSRFCGTCGVPVNGASADERGEGAENVNAPTVRVLTCPACRAICDADSNFCDNCGGALGDAEPLAVGGARTPAKTTKEVMYCKGCGETVEELSAKYCEECGEVLEKKTIEDVSEGPPAAECTLTPHGVKEVSAPQRALSTAPPSTTNDDKRHSAGGFRQANTKIGSSEDNRGGPKVPSRGPGNLSPSSPKKCTQESYTATDYEAAEVGERLECQKCGRKFAPEALQRHERICASQKQRKVFNMRAQRLAGTEAMSFAKKIDTTASAPAPPKKDWRAESEAFRRSMKEARMVDKVLKSGGNLRNLPPPTYSENSHYTPCPHCGRKFAPDVAERHIPRCANTVNKPKAPPRRRF